MNRQNKGPMNHPKTFNSKISKDRPCFTSCIQRAVSSLVHEGVLSWELRLDTGNSAPV